METTEKKYCKKCETWLGLCHFPKATASADEYHCYCKYCCRKATQENYKRRQQELGKVVKKSHFPSNAELNREWKDLKSKLLQERQYI